jgi:hypothetical protein
MAVTITTNPAEIGMAKGQMTFGINTDNSSATHIYLQVLVEYIFGSGTYEYAFDMALAVDASGDAVFRLEERLRTFLAFKLPDVNDADPQTVDGPIKRYKIKYAEKTPEDLVYIENKFHSDTSGTAPYNEYLALDDPLEATVKYLIVAEVETDALIGNVALKLGASSQFANSPARFGFDQHFDFTPTLAYDEMQIPANVNFRIYKNALTYTTSAVFYGLLGAFSKKYFVPPPAAPGSLFAIWPTSSSIELSWSDNSSDESGFIIERDTDVSFNSPTEIPIAANDTAHSDTGLTHSTQYYYRIKATGASGDSAWSNITTATTLYALIITTNFNPATDGTFDPEIGTSAVDEIPKWIFEDGSFLTGNAISTIANGLDGTDQVVIMELLKDPLLMDYIKFNGDQIKGTLDFRGTMTESKEILVYDNPNLNDILLGTHNNTNANILSAYNCDLSTVIDLSGFTPNGTERVWLQNNPNLLGVTLWDNAVDDGYIDFNVSNAVLLPTTYKPFNFVNSHVVNIGSTNVVTLDLTSLLEFGSIYGNNNASLTTVNFNASPITRNSTALWIIWMTGGMINHHINMSNWILTASATNGRIWLTNNDIPQITFPINEKSLDLEIKQNRLGTNTGGLLDLSPCGRLSKVVASNDTSITSIKLSATVNLQAFELWMDSNDLSTIQNLSQQTLMANKNDWRFYCRFNSMSAAEVNTVLIDLDTAIDAVHTFTGSILINGNTAPSGAGITAAANLVARGLTVTTD